MATATILVCDDEAVLRSLVRASLDDAYSIVEARDGDEALELAQSRRPDLIVIDMMMPGRTGLEVVAALRADDELADTPVIMLTSRAQAADRAAASEAGVDHYLTKPFSPRDLSTLVHQVLEAAST
jgi:Response regulators consisting of a CheY-like receiver domain and a winged-helix DNA-binding domain